MKKLIIASALLSLSALPVLANHDNTIVRFYTDCEDECDDRYAGPKLVTSIGDFTSDSTRYIYSKRLYDQCKNIDGTFRDDICFVFLDDGTPAYISPRKGN